MLLKVGDDISTDEIMPAGARILPFRSNIPRIARFVFEAVDEGYVRRAEELGEHSDHVVIAGDNYGQGSSREHAALAPRYLGLRAVIAKGFARIHWQNLVNFGVLPLVFADPADYDALEPDDHLRLQGLRELGSSRELRVENTTRSKSFRVRHDLSPRQVEVLAQGGLINWMKARVVERQG